MYLSFFGLNRDPFHITPDPDFLFLSPTHKEAIGAVIYGIEQRKGFVAITGEVGTGKTTILRAYLKRIEQNEQIKAVYLFNPDLTFDELLRVCARELGIEHSGQISAPELLEKIHGSLIDHFREGRNVVLLVDEAQNMPVQTMERLRMLSNLETNKEKLIQIVLVGQPELERKLRDRSLRQLRQRLVVHARIKALTGRQSKEYIDHRLSQAETFHSEVISGAAVREVVKRARGNPRVINILCDNSLVAAYGAQRRPVPRRIVREVWSEMQDKPRRIRVRLGALLTGVLILVGLAALVHEGNAARWVNALQDLSAATIKEISMNSPLQSEARYVQQEPTVPAPVVAQEGVAEPEAIASETVKAASTPESNDVARNTNQERADLLAALIPHPEVGDPGNEIAAGTPLPRVAESIKIAAGTPLPQAAESIKIAAGTPLPQAAESIKIAAGTPLPQVAESIKIAAGTPLPQAAESIKIAAGTPLPQAAESIKIAAGTPLPQAAESIKIAAGTPLPQKLAEDNDSRGRLFSIKGSSIKGEGEEIVAVKKVERGDCLSHLISNTYGYCNDSLIRIVQEKNPQLSNPNIIVVGETIKFPKVSEANRNQ